MDALHVGEPRQGVRVEGEREPASSPARLLPVQVSTSTKVANAVSANPATRPGCRRARASRPPRRQRGAHQGRHDQRLGERQRVVARDRRCWPRTGAPDRAAAGARPTPGSTRSARVGVVVARVRCRVQHQRPGVSCRQDRRQSAKACARREIATCARRLCLRHRAGEATCTDLRGTWRFPMFRTVLAAVPLRPLAPSPFRRPSPTWPCRKFTRPLPSTPAR